MSHKEMILGWTVGSALLLVSLWQCSLNARIFWDLFVRKVHTGSWVPLVGGITGCFGLLLIPIDFAHKLCWLPLLLDYGSLPGIIHTIIAHTLFLIRGKK